MLLKSYIRSAACFFTDSWVQQAYLSLLREQCSQLWFQISTVEVASCLKVAEPLTPQSQWYAGKFLTTSSPDGKKKF